jgi:hypothetical protein
MTTDAKVYADALAKLRAGGRPDPHTCMDFLEGLGYCVAPLGNEEIMQLTEEILSEMDQESDV